MPLLIIIIILIPCSSIYDFSSLFISYLVFYSCPYIDLPSKLQASSPATNTIPKPQLVLWTPSMPVVAFSAGAAPRELGSPSPSSKAALVLAV